MNGMTDRCQRLDEFVCETVAFKAFERARARQINPGELARGLRELFAICDGKPLSPLCRELKGFLDVDLSDYPYSLAINDRPALAALDRAIAEWTDRLAAAVIELKACASRPETPAPAQGRKRKS
jgi:hypothetical protein